MFCKRKQKEMVQVETHPKTAKLNDVEKGSEGEKSVPFEATVSSPHPNLTPK
jgi:hypothetical protein